MNHLYALFVGINQYATIRPLSGCENDVMRVTQFLQQYVAGNFQFHPKSLLTRQATKYGIEKNFREHLIRENIEQGDVLLFYFSGHGAEEEAHEVFWHSEPNRKLQVLACYDSNLDTGKNFLADKELRYLLHQAARPGVEVITIFDCCHSGDNTRALPPGGVQERLAGLVPQRDWADFIFGKEISSEDIAQKSLEKALPQGRHIQLAACDSHESAYERVGNGGFFTTALIDCLNISHGDISYLDLKNRVRNLIRGENLEKGAKPQTPQIYAYEGQGEGTILGGRQTRGRSLFKSFLGGALKDKPIASHVYFNRQEQRWEVDKGAIYGVTEMWEDTPQQVIVPTAVDGTTLATIKKVFPAFSIIEFEAYADVFTGESYFGAFIPSLMTRALPFSVTGEQAGTAIFHQNSPRQQLANDGLRLVDNNQIPEFNVLAKNNQYLITLPGDERPLTQPTRAWSPLGVQEVLGHLRKIGRWAFVKNLRNEHSEIPATAFDMKVAQSGKQVVPVSNTYTLNLPTINKTGRPAGKIEVSIANNSSENLYYGVVYLSTLFEVSSGYLPGNVMLLETGKSHMAIEDDISLEDFIREFNWPEEYFHLLVIAAASEFSLDLLDQEGLEKPTRDIFGLNNSSNQSKGGRLKPEDWQTRLLTFRMPNPDYVH